MRVIVRHLTCSTHNGLRLPVQVQCHPGVGGKEDTCTSEQRPVKLHTGI